MELHLRRIGAVDLDPSRDLASIQYRIRSDEQLLSLARAGNHAAFTELVNRNRDHVYSLALLYFGNERDAGEVLCESFVMAFRAIDSIHPACSPAQWFFQQAFQVICDRMAARREVPMQRQEDKVPRHRSSAAGETASDSKKMPSRSEAG